MKEVIKTAAFAALIIAASLTSAAQSTSPGVHDPVMIQENEVSYIFATGNGIHRMKSTDMVTWEQMKPVFDEAPAWAVEAIPGFKGHIWAPDISLHNGVYYLYYSVSQFAKNTSCIGVATNTTLDPDDSDYKWVDHGKVIQSVPERDMWNAIDPNLIIDDEGTPWLCFGSFWDGIRMVKLSPDLLSIAQPEEWHAIARRERTFDLAVTDPGDGAIEAPFIFKKGDYYYLFVSFDLCCRGPKSNYKLVVGRSNNVTGPYIDKTGKKMVQGGGTILLEGNEDWFGLGHNSVYNINGKDVMLYHAYDAHNNGRPILQIRNIEWDNEGWPVVK